MTITIVYASSGDGYLQSSDVTYSVAQSGGGAIVLTGSPGRTGQGYSSALGSYTVRQSFISFAYPAIPAGECLTSAAIRLKIGTVDTPAVARDLEIRAAAWTSGGLTAADWQSTSALNAATLYGSVTDVQGGGGKYVHAGSDALVDALSAATSLSAVLVTDRQRTGTVPTGSEAIEVQLSGAAGTVDDPALIMATVERSTLFGALGAQVTLSDGSWAYLESSAANPPTVTLKRITSGGTVSTIGALTLASSGTAFAYPEGAQALALAVGPDNSLYVAGRFAGAVNSLAVQCWQKAPGSWSWTAKTIYQVPLPSYGTKINNVAVAYHAVASGVLYIAASHRAAGGSRGGGGNDLSWVTVSSDAIRTGTGTVALGSGTMLGTLQPQSIPSDTLNAYANEVGTGLDVVADLDNPSWGYVLSHEAVTPAGGVGALALGRYILKSDGTGLSFTSYADSVTYGTKDSGGKARVVPIPGGIAVAVGADSTTGRGLTLAVRQHSGTTPGSVSLGSVVFAGESIPSMPDGPAVGGVASWDAAYNAASNKVHVYYVDRANPRRLMRTSVDLNTYQATRSEVQAYLAPSGTAQIRAVRVARVVPVTQYALLSVAVLDGATWSFVPVVDTFALAPTAPALTPKANYDAATAGTFAWTFSDPNTGDTQSAYQLQIQNASTGTTVYDTGKVTSTATSHVVPGGTLANEVSYRWRVMTWDSTNLASPWSDWGTFSTSASGTVTITDPPVDNAPGIATSDYTVRWTVSGTTQAAYRAWLYRGGSLVTDTGWVTSTSTFWIATGLVSDVEHEVRIQVRNSSGVVSGIASRKITPSYATPEIPVVTTATIPESGYTLVSVTNPPPGSGDAGPLYDFETGDVAAWFRTGCTFAVTTEQADTGTHSAKLTTTGGVSKAYVRAPDKPVSPATRYELRFRVFCPVATSVSATIDWHNASGAWIGLSEMTYSVPANTWTEVKVAGNAPSAAAVAKVGPSISGTPPAGVVVYVDGLQIKLASDRPEVSRNDILRRVSGSPGPWTVLGSTVPGGTYRDYSAASGVTYEYRARGVAASGAYTDSAVQTATLKLQGVWIHDPLDPVGTIAAFPYGRASRSGDLDVTSGATYYAGREYPVVDYGEPIAESVAITVVIPFGPSWAADLARLKAACSARRSMVIRDNRGRMLCAALSGYRERDQVYGTEASFSALRVDVVPAEVVS
ncbi:MAG TPA: carbohydrate binding domain-containing protein [Armatimonadota bacterium]|nr:carbohydrate binding domain-containing protein [Armatimonadota bacterium]